MVDVVTIGDCTLYHGDALEVLPTLAQGSVDAVVTDPPYSSGGMMRGDRATSTRKKYQQSDVLVEHQDFDGDTRDQRGWAFWSALWLNAARRTLAVGGLCCMFTDWRQLPTSTDVLQAGGFVWRGIVPWDKVVSRPMAGRFRSQAEYIVWGTNGPSDITPKEDSIYMDGVMYVVRTVPSDDREHATQKPVGLMRLIVPVVPEGCAVLDPFMGTGSTGVAAILEGRRFVGVESSRHFFDIACTRIAKAYEDRANPLFGEEAPKPVQKTMELGT